MVCFLLNVPALHHTNGQEHLDYAPSEPEPENQEATQQPQEITPEMSMTDSPGRREAIYRFLQDRYTHFRELWQKRFGYLYSMTCGVFPSWCGVSNYDETDPSTQQTREDRKRMMMARMMGGGDGGGMGFASMMNPMMSRNPYGGDPYAKPYQETPYGDSPYGGPYRGRDPFGGSNPYGGGLDPRLMQLLMAMMQVTTDTPAYSFRKESEGQEQPTPTQLSPQPHQQPSV